MAIINNEQQFQKIEQGLEIIKHDWTDPMLVEQCDRGETLKKLWRKLHFNISGLNAYILIRTETAG